MQVGCRQHDYRILEFRVPEMNNQACADIVQKAVMGAERIKVGKPAGKASAKAARERAISKLDVDIDLQTKTVRLWYDSIMTAEKNIEYRVSDAGFRVETQSRGELITIPANPAAQAKLPPECR